MLVVILLVLVAIVLVQALKMLVLVVIALCWAPWQAYFLAAIVYPPINQWVPLHLPPPAGHTCRRSLSIGQYSEPSTVSTT